MTAEIVIGIFAALWILGWIFTIRDTETSGGWFRKFVVGPVILFFIWPYVAWYMMRQMG